MPHFYPVEPLRRLAAYSALCVMIWLTGVHSANAQPVITSVNPATGPGKMQFIITGHNFSPYPYYNTVTFGTTQGLVLYGGTDTLRVQAPMTSSYQPISLEVSGLTAIAGQSYDQTFGNGGVPFTSASFSGPVNFATDGNDLSIIDLNLDGKPDIISTGGGVSSGFAIRSYSVLSNSGGSGTLGFNLLHFPTTTNAYRTATADLDADTWPDLISWDSASDGSNEIRFFHNAGPGAHINFDAGTGFKYGNKTIEPKQLLLRDFDGDGLLDILTDGAKVVGSTLQSAIIVLRNNGSAGHPSFVDTLDIIPNATNGSPGDYQIADLDGDGKPDLILGEGTDLYFFRNVSIKGAIAFAAPTLIAGTTGAGTYIQFADIDGDGRPDLVGVDQSTDVILHLNTSSGGSVSFGPQVLLVTGNGADPGMAFGDLDGDGKPDLVIANGGENFASVFRNASTPGHISFDTQLKLTTTDGTYPQAHPYNAYITDLDGDQRPEIIISDGIDHRVTVFQNKLAAAPAPKITAVTPGSATAGQTVGIKGTNFTGALYVSFGGVAANSFKLEAADSITAVVGAGANGYVAVTTPGGSDTLRTFLYTTPLKPVLSAFTPTTATTGDTVHLTGKHFITAQSVSFGGVAATYLGVLNDSTVIAVVGSGRSGSVKVTTQAGADSLAGFVYNARQPVVYSFIPTSGKPLDTVLVKGADFTGTPGVTGVSFGGVASPYFHVFNDSVLYAIVSPNGASGAVSVTNGTVSGSLAGFTFIRPAPTVRSFYPSSAHSGDTVVISGSNLTGATIVEFGGTHAARYVVVNDSEVVATVGSGATGEVAVFTPKGSDSIGVFTYLGAPDTTHSTPPDTTHPAAPGTFRILYFQSQLINGEAVLFWAAQHDSSILSYTIQEGSDSTALTDIASVGSRLHGDTSSYIWPDREVRTGKVWYRLIVIDSAGRRVDGPFVSITFAATQATGIFPNPAVGVMTALVPNTAVQSQFELADANGRVLMVIPVSPGNTSVQVSLAGLNPGTYRLTWSDGHRRTTKTVLILK